MTSLILNHDQTADLIKDDRVDYVAFTGSVEGGRLVQEAARRRFIDVGLELGGNDAAYLAEDAELALAVPTVIDGACYNAGQSCCAVERVYVHESIHERFVAIAQEVLRTYRLDDPERRLTSMGPMASATALPFLQDQVEDALNRGAKLVTGGGTKENKFFEPTLLVDCPNDAKVMQEETFGPLVPIRSVRSDEEALQLMNDSRFGLTASVWTRQQSLAEKLAPQLEVGTVFQNRADYLDPGLPWTGVKDSGRGSTLSRYGFFHLTRRKSIHFNYSP